MHTLLIANMISREICSKLIQDDPGFAKAHECLAFAYWGKRMYPQGIAEFKSLNRHNGVETQVVRESSPAATPTTTSSPAKNAIPNPTSMNSVHGTTHLPWADS